MNPLLAGAAGMALVAGILLTASGWPRRPRPPRARRQLELPVGRLVAALVVGVVVLVVTGWLVAAAAAAIGVWLGSRWWDTRRQVSDEVRAEAIAVWVESLRDTIRTGRGLEGVLVVTAPTAPAPIRPQVGRIAQRIQDHEPLDVALEEGARDLDHPVSDLALTALAQAARSGGSRIGEVLDDLATVAHGQAEVHRRLSVAYARPRATLRYVAAAIVVAVTLLALVARDYLAPYATGEGQVVLAGIGAVWVAALVWMHRLGTPEVRRHVGRPTP